MVNAATPELDIPADNDVTYASPSINGYNVFLDGVSGNGGGLAFNDGTSNTLNFLYVLGGNSGSVVVDPTSSLTISHGMQIDGGTLTMNDGGNGITLNGTEAVENGSTLTALGGRGQDGVFTLNGTLNVSNDSAANFNAAILEGRGTVDIGTGSTVLMKQLLAGLHVNVGAASSLWVGELLPQTAPPISAGMINEAAGGTVFIGGTAKTATREIFHQASGAMDLLNKSGAQVSSIQFAPGSHEYASVLDLRTGPGATAGGVVTGSMEITTNAHFPGNLPTTFTH
jgi:hypothetical protein